MKKGFSKAERRRFDKARAQLAPRITAQVEAIEASTQLSAKDYAVRINAR